jgi:3-deoxy-D-manno-octulosonic acid kinase
LSLPTGLSWIEAETSRGFATEEAADWVRAALAEHGSLWKAGESAGPRETLGGRAPILVVEGPGDSLWVIRRYWRGGGMRFLEDRHLRLGSPRPVRESWASHTLRSRDIPTPAVVAAGIYPSGIFHRADLVTEFVPDAVDLSALLFDAPEPWGSDPDLRLGALARVGVLVHRLARAGGQHPDLNARNLLASLVKGDVRPWVIDLDRCRVSGRPVPVRPLLERLERSAHKIGEQLGAFWPAEAWGILKRGAEGGDGA